MKILKPVLFIQLLCYKGKILNIYFYFFSSNESHTLFINVVFLSMKLKAFVLIIALLPTDRYSGAISTTFQSF